MKPLTVLNTMLVITALATSCLAQPIDGPPEGMRQMRPPFGGKHPMMDQMRDRMENVDECIETLSEYDPEIKTLFEQVQKSKTPGSRKFVHQLAREGRFVMALNHPGSSDELKTLFVSYVKLELHSILLADEITSSTDEADKEQLTAQLRDLIAQSFDIKQQLRAQRLIFLEKKLEETKKQLDERAANKDKIIEQRFNSLLSVDDELEW